MLQKLKKSGFLWALVVGTLVRLFLMPTTYHVDLLGHSFTAYFFAYEGELNPYEALVDLPPGHPMAKNYGIADIFIYPPAAYFTLGIFRLLIKPFVDPNFLPFLMANPSLIHSRSDLFLNEFLYKLPYLFVDIAIAFLLAGLFEERKKKKMAFWLWMLNPVTLYATFMIGQVDIMAVFFTVLSLYLFKQKKYSWSLVSLGVGGAYKMYPLLLLIPVAFLTGDTLIKRIKNLIIGFAPFLMTILPYLGSSAFRYMVFSPKSQKMLFMGWNLSGAEVIFPFILFLGLIYLYSYYSKKLIHPANYFLAILLLTFSLTHYHPQWFVWVSPLLIWVLVKNNFLYWEVIFGMVMIWVFITLCFEPSLSIALFNPIYPSLEKLPGVSDILGKYVNVFQMKSIARSIFAAGSAFLVYREFSTSHEKEEK